MEGREAKTELLQPPDVLELARASGADNLSSKYQVLRPLGVGGVGFVVAARHVGFDAEVALKFLHPQYAADPDCASRFLREARAQFRIRSPHVARVLNVEQPETGSPFIVLELLQGTDLRSLLDAESRLDVARACRYALQVCSGLGAAHALGIVHCDLKPENLFVTPDGIKILDFGIAQLRERGPRTDPDAPKVALGTPAYMAPEQLLGERADARTDLWALGCVLYEMLAGESPFARDTQELTCSAVLREPPLPLDERRPDLPPPLCLLVMRCLSRSPARRFQHARELAEAIERARSARVDTASVLPARRALLGSTSLRLMAAVTCCTLALAWLVHARRVHAPRPVVVSSAAPAPAATLWVDSALLDEPVPAPQASEAQGWSTPAAARRARSAAPARRPRAAREQSPAQRREPTPEPDVGF